MVMVLAVSRYALDYVYGCFHVCLELGLGLFPGVPLTMVLAVCTCTSDYIYGYFQVCLGLELRLFACVPLTFSICTCDCLGSTLTAQHGLSSSLQ